MRRISIVKIVVLINITALSTGCIPFDKIYSHDFNSGYFKLKTSNGSHENVYLNLSGDSIVIYKVTGKSISVSPEIKTGQALSISDFKPGNYLYNSSFIKTNVDLDLSTAVLKFRPAMADVPSQLSANVNGLLYAGFRQDYYKLKSLKSPLQKTDSFIRHTGYDFGVFAGIGITPVNPTVTMNQISQEYDGIVFQKGIAAFFTFENMSVGLALGFDNLLDQNKTSWIYNQKPWLGIFLGIANF